MTSVIQKFCELPFLVPPRSILVSRFDELMSYTSAPIVDRTRVLQPSYLPNIVIESEIPSVVKDPGDFDSVTDRRALEIMVYSASRAKPIAVLYSGGMDSTCVAAAFLKAGARILIVGSDASIKENPRFYNEILLNNDMVRVEIGNPLRFLRDNKESYTFVSGECGAHLMGTINWTKYGGREIEAIDSIEADHLAAGIFKSTKLFHNIPDNIADLLRLTLDKSPVEFKTNYDAQWWSIYALKWQFVSYRIQMFIGTICPHFFNFFMSNDYEHWALFNDVTVKCPDFEWRNYKMPIRDYIYEFSHLRSASYEMPKRISIERTYGQLRLGDTFVIDNPKEVGFTTMSSKTSVVDNLRSRDEKSSD